MVDTALMLQDWLIEYKQSHREILDSDPEFAAWLEEGYIPIAGGWQY